MEYVEPEIISEVSKVLREKVPRGDENLESHIIELVSLQCETAIALADTIMLLHQKRKQLLWPKDKETTELDRKTKLDADTAPVQRTYELLARLEQLLYQRIQVCIQLLG